MAVSYFKVSAGDCFIGAACGFFWIVPALMIVAGLATLLYVYLFPQS
jgi:hypothetical protein